MVDIHAHRLNRENFAFECFDEEIVVLNVVDGVYYAFRGAAVVAWPYIIAQHSEPVIASALAGRYDVQLDALAHDLTEFIERLVQEKILLVSPETNSEINCSQLAFLGKYEGFIFERHADMEDLLTLDPIHDIDPRRGWPNT